MAPESAPHLSNDEIVGMTNVCESRFKWLASGALCMGNLCCASCAPQNSCGQSLVASVLAVQLEVLVVAHSACGRELPMHRRKPRESFSTTLAYRVAEDVQRSDWTTCCIASSCQCFACSSVSCSASWCELEVGVIFSNLFHSVTH